MGIVGFLLGRGGGSDATDEIVDWRLGSAGGAGRGVARGSSSLSNAVGDDEAGPMGEKVIMSPSPPPNDKAEVRRVRSDAAGV
jgi:hypothetical protein